MAAFVLKNVEIRFGQIDLTGVSNQVALSHSAEMQDVTPFAADDMTRVKVPGLLNSTAEIQGFFQTPPDDLLFARVGAASAPLTIADSNVEGSSAFLIDSATGQFNQNGSVGDIYSTDLQLQSNSPLTRGVLGVDGLQSTAGNSSAFNLGAVAPGSTLHSALHVVEANGTLPTLDVTIESDDNAGFTSPVTRGTFLQQTDTLGFEFLRVAGPITDAFWRVTWTIGGTGSPNFTFTTSLGISS